MAQERSRRLRVLLVGTFDREHSRNRTIRRQLERAGYDVRDCRVELWGPVRYSKLRSDRLRTAARAALAYLRLIARSVVARRPDAVLMLYPGHLDVLVLAPIWRARRVPVVFDPLISLRDTIVVDRKMHEASSLVGRLSLLVDRWSFRLANLVLTDTPEVADHYCELTGVPRSRFEVLWPGVNEAVFSPPSSTPGDPTRVLFYGSFIALHGVDTIVRAARLLMDRGVTVRIIGTGQERWAVEEIIALEGITNVELVGTVPLEELPGEIRAAGICLGIFGTSSKAARVVPFKVFECLAMGRPVVTGDTAAVRGALDGAVWTVPTGDPEALAQRIAELIDDPQARAALARAGHERYQSRFGEAALAELLAGMLASVLRLPFPDQPAGGQRAEPERRSQM
jgi:glycosyltransferase involved in cell wall biosynthesis